MNLEGLPATAGLNSRWKGIRRRNLLFAVAKTCILNRAAVQIDAMLDLESGLGQADDGMRADARYESHDQPDGK